MEIVHGPPNTRSLVPSNQTFDSPGTRSLGFVVIKINLQQYIEPTLTRSG
jgi:hypothetical protein